MQVLPDGTCREVARTMVGEAVFLAHSTSSGALPRLPSPLVAPHEGDVTLESSDRARVSA